MSRQVVEVPAFAAWTHASSTPVSLVIRAAGLVYVSGMPPLDPATGRFEEMDIRAQTTRVMENLKLCLSAAGTSFENVIQARVYVTNSAYFGIINEVYGAYFEGPPPTRTFVTVASWPAPFDLEIEMTALA